MTDRAVEAAVRPLNASELLQAIERDSMTGSDTNDRDRAVIRTVFRLHLRLVQADQPKPANDNPWPLLSPDELYAVGEEARGRAERQRQEDSFKEFLKHERQRGGADHDFADKEEGGPTATAGADLSADLTGKVAGEGAAATGVDGREGVSEGDGGAGVG